MTKEPRCFYGRVDYYQRERFIVAKILLATCFSGEKIYQVSPPLGLLYIGASLIKKGHIVKAVDTRAFKQTPDDLVRLCLDFKPDILGLSAVHREIVPATQTAKKIKKLMPETTVVIGGPGVTSGLNLIEKIPEFDFAVLGEGEVSFPNLVKATAAGENCNKIPGVYFRDKNLMLKGADPNPIENLDALPFPAWHLLGMNRYHKVPRHGYISRFKEYYSVLSSRGCPYQCTFCQNTFGRKFRYRSAQNVIDEVYRLVKKYNIREIHFPDDCFNLKKSRAIEIFQGINRRGLKIAITFPSGLRGDLLDREVLQAAKKAGVYKIPFGVETASPRLQKMLKKNVDLPKIRKAIRIAADLGIIAQGFFMLGFPTETEDEIRTTVDFASKSRLHLASFNFVNAFPGTELFDQAKELGLPVEKVGAADFDYDDPPVALSKVPLEKLPKIARLANSKFYFNPIRLLRIFSVLPHKRQFLGLVAIFISKVFFNLKENTQKALSISSKK